MKARVCAPYGKCKRTLCNAYSTATVLSGRTASIVSYRLVISRPTAATLNDADVHYRNAGLIAMQQMRTVAAAAS